ncbi:MAG: hypothetical protein LZF61_05870 [Nitrosomonas sp.]|nr:MAG: hypothetical protein LZF61_05870 [Nitrosomonas sp.]
MINDHLPGYTTGDKMRRDLHIVKTDAPQTMQSLKSESTQSSGFGGGGDNMNDKRISILETHVSHINTDIAEIRSAIRAIDGKFSGINSELKTNSRWSLGIIVTVLVSAFTLYVIISSAISDLSSDAKILSTKFEYMKDDVTTLKSDISSIKSFLEKLTKDK